jgi:hypothetical protein
MVTIFVINHITYYNKEEGDDSFQVQTMVILSMWIVHGSFVHQFGFNLQYQLFFLFMQINFELITLTFSKCHHEVFAQPFYLNMWSERIKHSRNAMYQKVCLNTLWQAFGDVSTSFNIFGLFLSFHHCWVFCYFGNTCTITCVTW